MGWIMTEMGRQPWIVYGILLTERGISKIVPTASIWASLIAYTTVYIGVALVALYLARKILLDGPDFLSE